MKYYIIAHKIFDYIQINKIYAHILHKLYILGGDSLTIFPIVKVLMKQKSLVKLHLLFISAHKLAIQDIYYSYIFFALYV